MKLKGLKDMIIEKKNMGKYSSIMILDTTLNVVWLSPAQQSERRYFFEDGVLS